MLVLKVAIQITLEVVYRQLVTVFKLAVVL